MNVGMRSVGVVAGWLARVHKHKDRFRERSEERPLAGHRGRPKRYIQMLLNFPPPKPS